MPWAIPQDFTGQGAKLTLWPVQMFCSKGLRRVGPESAGANPGPACYRQGGPLTVTDASALLADFSDRPRADRVYDADERVRFFGPSADRKRLEKDQCSAVIPSKANRKVPYPDDKYLYKARHLIENFFAKLKQYRGIATRYDKTASNFLGAIYLAVTVIWLN